jgi:hypothetical protein
LSDFWKITSALKIVQKYSKKVLTWGVNFEMLSAHTEQLNKNMRTKSILLGAALLAAGLASSMAQVSNVYSVNVVGYVNLTLTNGLNLISNPLDAVGNGGTVSNTIKNVFGVVPDGTQVYKYTNGGTPATSGYIQSDAYLSFAGGWLAGGIITFNPGEGLFVQIPNGTGTTNITFVGTVVQATSLLSVSNGLNIIASQAPIAGGIQTVQGYQANNGDQLYYWDATHQTYTSSYAFVTGLGWLPSEPQNTVGQSVFIVSAGPNVWTNTFVVH